jgi:hypothetical protein
MLIETDRYFVKEALQNPQSQVVEEVASESHETRRIPDPYIFIQRNNKFETPQGEIVEKYIDKNTPLGKSEFHAFNEIQKWANETDEGFCVWFSPTHKIAYPQTKIIIQEIEMIDEQKVVINRAIILNKDDNFLLRSANELSNKEYLDKEILRKNPVFPESDRFFSWFESLAVHIDQIKDIQTGKDTQKKLETYAAITEIAQSINIYGTNNIYNTIYQQAQKRDIIGKFQGSCPISLQTAFQTVFNHSINITSQVDGKREMKRKLKCTCPFCSKKVEATISNGKIHCPECKKSADYNC